MASIHHEATIDVSAEAAWARLRQVDQAHTLFAPVLVDGTFDRDAQTRTVRFANGMVVQERILDVDEARRRVAYTVVDGAGMSYHHASMEIIERRSDALPVRLGQRLPARGVQGPDGAARRGGHAGSESESRDPLSGSHCVVPLSGSD